MNVLSCTKSQWRVMNILSCTKSQWKSIECVKLYKESVEECIECFFSCRLMVTVMLLNWNLQLVKTKPNLQAKRPRQVITKVTN